MVNNDINKKASALEKLPVDDICDTLTSAYGLKIDKSIDRNLKIVTEWGGSSGHKQTRPGGAKGAKVGVTLSFPIDHACWENETVGEDRHVVNIVFLPRNASFVFKQQLIYDVVVMDNDVVLVQHSDEVAILDTPTTKFMFADINQYWDNVVFYADKVNEALIRDINRTKQAETSKQGDD